MGMRIRGGNRTNISFPLNLDSDPFEGVTVIEFKALPVPALELVGWNQPLHRMWNWYYLENHIGQDNNRQQAC